MMKLKNRKGITLIELVITLGLIGVITALVFSFYFSNKRTLNNVEIKSALQYEANTVMNEISRHAMEATKVEYGPGNMTISFLKVDGSKVVFTVSGGRSIESEGKIILKGNDISIGDGTESDVILCTTLKELILNGDKDKSINVKLVLEKNGIEYSVVDSFLFRNSGL